MEMNRLFHLHWDWMAGYCALNLSRPREQSHRYSNVLNPGTNLFLWICFKCLDISAYIKHSSIRCISLDMYYLFIFIFYIFFHEPSPHKKKKRAEKTTTTTKINNKYIIMVLVSWLGFFYICFLIFDFGIFLFFCLFWYIPKQQEAQRCKN